MDVHLRCVDDDGRWLVYCPPSNTEGFVPQVVCCTICSMVHVVQLKSIVAMAPERNQIATHALELHDGWHPLL